MKSGILMRGVTDQRIVNGDISRCIFSEDRELMAIVDYGDVDIQKIDGFTTMLDGELDSVKHIVHDGKEKVKIVSWSVPET